MNTKLLEWNALAASVLNIHTNPGHDARRMAIIHIAVHDALNSINAKYLKFGKKPPRPRNLNTPINPVNTDSILFPGYTGTKAAFKAAVSATTYATANTDAAVCGAYYVALNWAINDIVDYINVLPLPVRAGFNSFNANDCYIPVSALAKTSMDSISGPGKEAGWYLGTLAAQQIIEKRATDGALGLNIFTATPLDGTKDGQFRADFYKLPPVLGNQNKLMFNYGQVKPFVIQKSPPYPFRQSKPPAYPKPDEYILNADYIEVKKEGTEEFYKTLPQSQKNIIDYWADTRQHILWNNFTAKLIGMKTTDEWITARIFALIHTAMADGVLCMFQDVYHFYHWRPVTAINNELGVIPNNTLLWKPYLATPRVPEYPSTFGIVGGVVSEILQKFFTNNISITLFLPNSPGALIHYTSISQAASDNALKKINCGWNFRKSADDGLKQGQKIGKYVLQNEFRS